MPEDLFYLFLFLAIVVFISILRGNGLFPNVRVMAAYANMDQLDFEKAAETGDEDYLLEQVAERVCMKVNLKIYEIANELKKINSLDQDQQEKIQSALNRLFELRPTARYSQGKFEIKVPLFDFDYSVYQVMHPYHVPRVQRLIQEAVVGVRYLNLILERMDSTNPFKKMR